MSQNHFDSTKERKRDVKYQREKKRGEKVPLITGLKPAGS